MVLIADDHPMLREAMRNVIEKQQDMAVIGEAGDGDEAVKLSLKLKPDIVIMDIVMPKLSGIEASKQIKNGNPSIAVLILTAYDDDRYIFGLLEAGAAGYLLKSARSNDIVEAIRAIHLGETVLHPSIIAKLLKRALQVEVKHIEPEEPKENKGGDILSPREMEIIRLASRGMSSKEIAGELSLAVRTVKAHLSNIFNKLSVASRTEAILKGLREGWLTLEEVQEDMDGG